MHKIRQVMEEKDELSKTLEVLEKHIEEVNIDICMTLYGFKKKYFGVQ